MSKHPPSVRVHVFAEGVEQQFDLGSISQPVRFDDLEERLVNRGNYSRIEFDVLSDGTSFKASQNLSFCSLVRPHHTMSRLPPRPRVLMMSRGRCRLTCGSFAVIPLIEPLSDSQLLEATNLWFTSTVTSILKRSQMHRKLTPMQHLVQLTKITTR
jgi:hypothetical protein